MIEVQRKYAIYLTCARILTFVALLSAILWALVAGFTQGLATAYTVQTVNNTILTLADSNNNVVSFTLPNNPPTITVGQTIYISVSSSTSGSTGLSTNSTVITGSIVSPFPTVPISIFGGLSLILFIFFMTIKTL